MTTLDTFAKQIRADLANATPGALLFLDELLYADPMVSTCEQIAIRHGTTASTLISRFLRAGLPTPKRYLAAFRLIRARQLLDDPRETIQSAALTLRHSSAQSFARHVKIYVGCTPVAFRCHISTGAYAEYVRQTLILPYAAPWHSFDPFEGTSSRVLRTMARRTAHEALPEWAACRPSATPPEN